MCLDLKLLKQILGIGLLAAATALPALPADDATRAGQGLSDSLSSLRRPSQIMTSDELFSKLLEHNRQRDLLLEEYSAVRTYQAKNDSGKLYAQETVVV